jgi:glycosyltransferase involved in cell wall biosynthesis
MSKNPTVTIGIPFLNPGNLILEAIQSVFAQTFADWELILVDDGSNDESLEIVQKIRDTRVTVLVDGKNRGLPYRLNQIIDLAKGDFIARMDADDIMHPTRIEKQVNFLRENQGCDLVATPVIVLDDERKPRYLLGTNFKKDKVIFDIFKNGLIVHPTILARRDWYMNNKYSLDYPRAEDRELFIRTFERTKICFIEEPLYFYYWPIKGLTKKVLKGYPSERKIILKYGPQIIGKKATYIFWLRSFLKSSFVTFISLIHRDDLLIKLSHAYEKLSSNEIEIAERTINEVRSIKVPGLNGEVRNGNDG